MKQVFIDAWMERQEPVIYIRSCQNGQALFCLKGDEIIALMNKQNRSHADLMLKSPVKYDLKEIVIQ